MADLLVVVPGITGSVLRDAAGRDVWNLSPRAIVGGLTGLRRTVGALRLPTGIGDAAPDDPGGLSAGGPITGWHLWPGFWAGGGYGRLLAHLESVNPGGVRGFGYDWRLSNRHTARLLSRQVERWLAEWRARPGNAGARVVFVCHSMGGLVVRYHLEVLGGREHARRVVTLGTPYRGAVKAISALTGDAFGGLGALGWDEPLTELARSLPAVYQLLPTYRCVSTAGGPAGLDTVSVPGADPAMVRDALAFHREIAAAVAGNGPPPYELYAFAGKIQATVQSVELGPVRRYRHEQGGVDHAGDGTVALFSAVPPEWPNTAPALLHAARHGGLPGTAALLDALTDKILARDLGGILAPPCELGLDVPEVVASGPVPVAVRADRADLLLHAVLREPGAEGPDPYGRDTVAEIRLDADGSGGYHGRIPAPEGIWRLDVTAVAETPPVTVGDYVTVASGSS
ncbi:hypothetical protein [Dactylosporangium sp. NPDC049140]|uniref:esterase/lipase family protein n=1 Tax=Dactylosporangium sp. NPDC049140 TaxID=3155647 RepID=UPI0033DE1A8B